MRNRATDLLPSVLLTVLSMIQALALELLWTRLRESPYLWTASWDALLGWTQATAMLLGFLVVWLLYISFVMRFRWLPSLSDSVIPFGIGILEFSLIDLMFIMFEYNELPVYLHPRGAGLHRQHDVIPSGVNTIQRISVT